MPKSLLFDINEVRKLFRGDMVVPLRGLSNRLIREASVENNYAKAELGVIAYALHKLETKEHVTKSKKWKVVKERIIRNLDGALRAIKENDTDGFFTELKRVIVDIEKIDEDIGHFAQSLYEKAKVKQASLAYSYGLSLSQASELTGAVKRDVQSYVGFTTMHDEEPAAKTLKIRVRELKELLR